MVATINTKSYQNRADSHWTWALIELATGRTGNGLNHRQAKEEAMIGQRLVLSVIHRIIMMIVYCQRVNPQSAAGSITASWTSTLKRNNKDKSDFI